MLSHSRRGFLHLSGLAVGFALVPAFAASEKNNGTPPNLEAEGWKALFDGKTLGGWKITEFAGRGEVEVEESKIVLEMGEPLTGVTFAGELLRQNYEFTLEAMRMTGSDFFCGLTFPVGSVSVTLVLGGWGGGVVGISNLDGQDASENETTQYIRFESNRWYRVRLRITPEHIEAWLGDDRIANVPIAGRKLGMRVGEIELSSPLGIASFRTRSGLRDLRVRAL